MYVVSWRSGTIWNGMLRWIDTNWSMLKIASGKWKLKKMNLLWRGSRAQHRLILHVQDVKHALNGRQPINLFSPLFVLCHFCSNFLPLILYELSVILYYTLDNFFGTLSLFNPPLSSLYPLLNLFELPCIISFVFLLSNKSCHKFELLMSSIWFLL